MLLGCHSGGRCYASRDMRASALFSASLFCIVACGDLKEAQPGGGAPAGGDPGSTGGETPSTPSAGDGTGPKVTAEAIVDKRSRLGARSSEGYRPWRSGIAVHDDRVYWVESGATPGIYSVAFTGGEVSKVATLARPAAFTATSTHLYVSDTNVVKRFPFGGGAPTTIASGADDVVNLATDGTAVFWTSGTDSAMNRTASGTTSTPIYSNGTPVGLAVAGDRAFWAGVDISGQIGALQSIKTSGSGAREVSRFSGGGFHTMGGTSTYLYYAEDMPANIHRLTVATNRDEIVDRDAQGVTDFAFDDQYAYWTEPGASDVASGLVRRVSHGGKTAETLAVSVAHPVALAVSGNTVFVAAAGTAEKSYADGTILRLTIE